MVLEPVPKLPQRRFPSPLLPPAVYVDCFWFYGHDLAVPCHTSLTPPLCSPIAPSVSASRRPEAHEDIADDTLERQTPSIQIPQAAPPSLPRTASDVMTLLKQVSSQGAIPVLFDEQRNHTRDAQVLVREPALIGLAESGQLTGKILKNKLMVRGGVYWVWRETRKNNQNVYFSHLSGRGMQH